MIKTVLIDLDTQSLSILKKNLTTYCPQIKISGTASCKPSARELIAKCRPQLVFFDTRIAESEDSISVPESAGNFETILLYQGGQIKKVGHPFTANDLLYKPIEVRELVASVRHIQHTILLKQLKQEFRQQINRLRCRVDSSPLIGISTMEGIYFLEADKIIRCEGLQRLTRVVSLDQGNIISSYNIGEFHRILPEEDFFATHRSHLINLRHIRQYRQDSTILMLDGSLVPVSRRRKCSFLDRIRQISTVSR